MYLCSLRNANIKMIYICGDLTRRGMRKNLRRKKVQFFNATKVNEASKQMMMGLRCLVDHGRWFINGKLMHAVLKARLLTRVFELYTKRDATWCNTIATDVFENEKEAVLESVIYQIIEEVCWCVATTYLSSHPGASFFTKIIWVPNRNN
jgi:hypothetical protein